MSKLQFTGERLMPGALDKTAMEHLHRYALCVELVKGKKVLDIASGEGYGSHLLAGYADHVSGVDLSEEAVHHAQVTYPKENLTFMQGSILDIPFPDSSFDVVVSFETLEHVSDHEQTMSEARRVLKTEGLLVISTPEKSVYSDQVNYANPYHEKELYEQEFRDLIHRYFNFSQVFFQKYVKGSLMVSSAKPNEAIRFLTGDFNGFNLNAEFQQEYMIAICSNSSINYNSYYSFFSNGTNEKILIERIVEAKIKKFKSGFRYQLIDHLFKPWDLLKQIRRK